jgi:predicted metalloprotease
MDRPQAGRAAAALVVLVCALVLSGCAVVVVGRPTAVQPSVSDVADDQMRIVGAGNDPVDVRVRNALVDLQDYWSSQFPAVFGREFTPLQGGYFSVDAGNLDPAQYPQGIGCGTDPRDVEGNAFYCATPNTPHSDSISYDRAFLGELADRYGPFLPDLVAAHEFGHAVQDRVGAPGSSIATETQADCLAGAWTAWVAAGHAPHARIRPPELDEVLQGYLLLRDPIGTSPSRQAAHGSGFDRVAAFQEGFDTGPTACRDHFGSDRVFTQGPFTSDADLANRGNAPYQQLQGLMQDSFAAFWTDAFPALFQRQFRTPTLQPYRRTPPGCPRSDLELVHCSADSLVGYDEPDLTRPLYDRIGDYAVITAVSIPYGLASRGELGRSTDDRAAYRSAVCLSGWFSAALVQGRVGTARVSPGDLDEGVQFLLQYADDPAVLPDLGLTGFQLVDLFRSGFVRGPRACDVGA